MLSIPAHRGFTGLATSAHVTHWRIQNDYPISHRQAEQGHWRSWFKHRLDSSAPKGLGYHRRHVDKASESGGTAKVFVVHIVSSGSIPAWDLDQRHQSFVGGWFDLQLDTSGNLWSDPPTPSTRCVCRWRNSPTPEHATAAHAHAHVPHARSVQPVRECPRFRAVKCDSVFIGRAAWHTPTLSMWHPGKSPLSRLPAFRVSGDSTTITSEGWQKTHARRMYPPRAQAFVSHSPRYIGKLFECPCVMR